MPRSDRALDVGLSAQARTLGGAFHLAVAFRAAHYGSA